MKCHPCLRGTVVELHVQWRHVGLEGQPRRALFGAKSIVDGAVLITHGKLGTDFDILILRQIFRAPSREAVRIAVVAPLAIVLGAVQIPKEIPGQSMSQTKIGNNLYSTHISSPGLSW